MKKFKKKLVFGLFAVFAIMTAALLPAIHVSAYAYHGLTYNWDRDGHSNTTYRGYSDADSDDSSGYLYTVGSGWAYADAYLNSAHVDAVDDVDHVTVWVTWDDEYKSTSGVINNEDIEIKLYINGEYQGVKSTDFPASLGVWYCTFYDVDIDTGDDLDVDIVLKADVGNSEDNGFVHQYAYFDFVEFISY